MKIPDKPPISALRIHDRFRIDQETDSLPPERDQTHAEKDTVALSGNAGNVREAIRLLEGIPEIREDKVSAMKRRIASGTYRITNQGIASRLIGETLENNHILDFMDKDRD